ncbi:MAG: tRNA preQ1(34) S-adenosylmethionine ribosyltransferase-isomerase QueA [Opitutales bacterium]
MNSELFNYHLPPDHIAQAPASVRDASKLMVVDRETGAVTHTQFAAIGDFLPRNTRFFRNNAAVLKARLFGQRPSGGKVECLLTHPAEDPLTWWCLLRPGKKTYRSGSFGLSNEYSADVLEANGEGHYRVRFHPLERESVPDLAERLGQMPLPPYIERMPDDPRSVIDAERYQTVYADPGRRIAAAAPTAGLHFTPELIAALEKAGSRFHDLSLRVGVGTFKPIETEHIEDHTMHHEWYEIPAPVFDAMQRATPGPRVAVGTTAFRAMEDAIRRTRKDPGHWQTPAGSIQAEADCFFYPPARFETVDALVTNFHLPKSSLLCLVAAFLTPGRETGITWIKELYQEAIAREYRFYSYGDAMLIL